jgi:hypothetical protein
MQPPAALLAQLLQHSQPLLPAANATDLAMLALGLGASGMSAATLRRVPVQASDSAGSVSSSSSSSSSSGSSWLADFMYCSYKALPAASPSDVVSLLVGLHGMRAAPGPRFLAAACVQALHHLQHMRASQTASLLLCLGRWRHKPPASFLQAVCAHTSPMLAATAAEAAARGAHECSSRSSGAASRQQFDQAGLQQLVRAFVLLDHQPPRQWCAQLRAAAAALQVPLPDELLLGDALRPPAGSDRSGGGGGGATRGVPTSISRDGCVV